MKETLPVAPVSINADLMSDAQIHDMLMQGIRESDNAVDAREAFAAIRDSRR